MSKQHFTDGQDAYRSSVGLFPSIFNLAQYAKIESNATCGDHNSEVYCKLDLEETPPSSHQCGICDTVEIGKSHSIANVVDGNSGTWWQAPSLQFGQDYHFVTITIDMKNVKLA